MKKTILLIFLVLLSLRIFAESASMTDANDVADFFLELNGDSLTIDSVVKFKDYENTLVAYIVTLDPQGFIVVTTDTDIRPIVAYSFRSNFIFDSDENNVLYHFLLNDMDNRLQLLSLGQLPDIELNNELWENYLSGDLAYFTERDGQQWPPEGTTTTGGWIETEWHGDPPYNNYCPYDDIEEERCVVGCGAVATSQILNYHLDIGTKVWTDIDDYTKNISGVPCTIDDDYGDFLFPPFPDLNTYLDDLRSIYEAGISINSSNQNLYIDEIASLCFMVGVAFQNSYGTTSYGSLQVHKLYDYFGYDFGEKIWEVDKDKFYPDLILDMKNAQPAYLVVAEEGTNNVHAIICDGYLDNSSTPGSNWESREDDFYHLNFGWTNSNYNCWYDLPEIGYVGIHDWTLICGILHISPSGHNGIISGNITLSEGSGDVTDVFVTAGYKTTNPDINGDYEIEIYNGTYDVKANLWGYEETIIEDIVVIEGEVTENVNLELSTLENSMIYIPTNYSSIQEGIDAAEDGDIVIVFEGTYFENINFNGKKIVVASWYYMNPNEYFIDNTIIDGGGDGRVVSFDHGEDYRSLLEGFTITNGDVTSYTDDNGAGIKCRYSSPILRNLKINNNLAENASALYIDNANPILENIDITDNYTVPSTGSVVRLSWSNPVFKNTKIYGNDYTGISSFRSNPSFSNVSICDNGNWGIHSYGGVLNFNNCLIWGNNTDPNEQILNYNDYSDIFITYSDIQGGWEGTGNISLYPLVDENYKPMWTVGFTCYSPLIDAGDPSIFDPDGTISDIGAVRAIDHKVETIELIDTTEGINWMCFPVINTISMNADLAENWLEDIWYNEILDEVKWVEDGATQLIEWVTVPMPHFTNPLHEFTSVQGYKISMHQSFDLDVTGFLEPPSTTIELDAGTLPGGRENWIGYFLEESMHPLDAFEAVLDDIDEIRTRLYTIVKIDEEWVPASEWTINYGDLVVVNCTEDCSFFWGEQGGGSVPKSTRSSAESFSYVEEADYIPVFVELDPEVLGDPTEIGIFVEDECKGAAVIEDSLVQICAYVLDDSLAFDPGSVEFQLYYGSRSENLLIDTYSIKENFGDAGNIGKLNFAKTQNRYYLISLKDSDNNVPAIIKTSLKQNYPNPFNPITTINYSLAAEGDVELTVYNIKGQKVRALVNEIKDSGHYQAVWDGTDNNKKQVASGVYFYRLSTGEKTINKKMLLLK